MLLREIMGRLHRLEMLRRIRCRETVLRSGLHMGQLPLIEYVMTHDGCTQKQAADELRISPASVAAAFKRAERDGLITRREDETDTRRNRVRATEKARRLAESSREDFDELDKKMFAGFTKEELDAFAESLDRMFQNLAGEEYRDMTVFTLMKMDRESEPAARAAERR